MNNELTVAAIVVTYNRRELLAECIDALSAQTYTNLKIYVIDNASTDGTREYIKKYIDNGFIIYINTGKNLGGAGGFNYGIKAAGNEEYDFLWIMDDDTVPNADALEKLVDAYKINKEIGYLSSKALWKDESLCVMNKQRDLSLHTIKDFSENVIPSAAATFVSLFVPLSVVKDVGLPIKDFFIWGDDLEYTRRISLKYKCYVITNSIVIHKMANNDNGSIEVTSEDRIDRYKYAYRNEVYLYRREGIKGWCHIILRTPLHVLRVLIKSKTKKCKRISVIISSTLRGIRFNPDIEYI